MDKILMSNGLEYANTESKEDKKKRQARASKMLKNVKSLDLHELKKEAEQAYTDKVAAKEKREKAIAEGRLKVAKPNKKIYKKKNK